MNITLTTSMKTFLKLENRAIKNQLSQIIPTVSKTALGIFQIFKMKTMK